MEGVGRGGRGVCMYISGIGGLIKKVYRYFSSQ